MTYIIIYLIAGWFFYAFMTRNDFWKTDKTHIKVTYSFFWPISIVLIFVLVYKLNNDKKEK